MLFHIAHMNYHIITTVPNTMGLPIYENDEAILDLGCTLHTLRTGVDVSPLPRTYILRTVGTLTGVTI